jgi:acyl dehydratase
MVNRDIIGLEFPPHRAVVEAGQLRFFAKAIGETDPVYFEDDAARAAGHPALPVPPTFFFSLEQSGQPFPWMDHAGITIATVLHGEQGFTYHRMAHAGDTLRFDSRITDVYDKKGGALQFIERQTRVTNDKGELVVQLRRLLVHRNG